MDSIDAQIPKKAKKDWTEKHCSLCNKHRGMHTIHNTKECRHYNRDGTHKKAVRMPKSDKPEHRQEGMNFVQVIHTKYRKAVCSTLKKSNHDKMCHSLHKDSDSDSDSDY